MKRIQLRVIPDERIPKDKPEYAANVLAWAEVVRQVIRRPLDPQKGADVDELRRSMRVLDALERASAVLELEDADWEHLKAKTLAMQWAFVDRRIISFIDDVTLAEEHVTLNAQLEEAMRGDGRDL